MRAKQVYEFTRNSNPLDTLGIGNKAMLYKFYDDLNIDRNDYFIDDNLHITFFGDLHLSNSNITKLIGNLYIRKSLYLRKCENLVELPDNLKINGYTLNVMECPKLSKIPENVYCNNLYLDDAFLITELPDSLTVVQYIFVNRMQFELINYIKNSKFKKTLKIR